MFELDLHKRRGDFELDLAFAAPPGSVVALFGPSGCGKSTAVNLIAGLLRPDRGRVAFDGTAVFDAGAGIDVPAEQRRIGYVFQDARLFPHMSVAQNLRYGLQRARAASSTIELEGVIELLGLGSLLQRRPHHLSGGEKQRVAIGRALLSQPRLLLLDEPLASLDFARRDEVLPYLERLRTFLRIPMVYVSHQFEEVLRLATHVVLLDHGRVVVQGDVSTVSLHPGLRTSIGADAIGAVVEARVTAIDECSGLARVALGNAQVSVDAQGLVVGQIVRLQMLARDLILALEPPRAISVRNTLQAVVTRMTVDDRHATLVELDVGGATLLARITTLAAQQLRLQAGVEVCVLVKAMMLRGHVFGTHNASPL